MQTKSVNNGTETLAIPIPDVGDHVIYVDPLGRERDALVTCVHCTEHWGYAYGPCVNLVFMSNDPQKTDNYGRQTERQTSIPNGMMPGLAHGNYWKAK